MHTIAAGEIDIFYSIISKRKNEDASVINVQLKSFCFFASLKVLGFSAVSISVFTTEVWKNGYGRTNCQL